MFESTPLYPDAGRYWDLVERHGVTIFYTAPTAIRALAAKGDDFVTRANRSSLRVLGTVGGPSTRRGSGTTPWWAKPGATCGHVVADRDGRNHDAPVAPATDQAWVGHPAAADIFRLVDTDNRVLVGPTDGHLCITPPGPARRGRCGETTTGTWPRAYDLPRPLLHRRWLPPRRPLLLDHRTGRRRAERQRPPHGHGRVRALW